MTRQQNSKQSDMETFGLNRNEYQNRFVQLVLDMDFIENCKDSISSIELNLESEYTYVYVNCDLSDKNEIFRLDKYSLDKIDCDYHIYLTHNCIEFLFKHEL